DAPISGLTFSPDGRRLAGSSFDGRVTMWEIQTRREVLTIKDLNGIVTSVTFSRDGRRLVTAWGGLVKLWDATSGQEVLTLRGHTEGCQCLAISRDGWRVASASVDRTIRIWDATALKENDGQELHTWHGFTGRVEGMVAISPDGTQLALTGKDV